MTVAALIVAVAALLVSVAAAWFTRRQSQSAATIARNDSDRRAEEVARAEALRHREAHADVTVDISPRTRNTRDHLEVRNRGPVASATNVSVEFVRAVSAGSVSDQLRAIGSRTYDLRAGESRALFTFSDDLAPVYEVRLRWTDASGEYDRFVVIDHVAP